MSTELEARLEQVESFVSDLKDREEITRLLALHAPAVDSGEADYWMANWTEDSVMDRPGDPTNHSGAYEGVYGKELMREEIAGPELAASRENGMMHLSTGSTIVIDGDVATATSYTQLIDFSRETFTYSIRFVIVNRWELARVDGRWMITRRTIRPLGMGEAVDLLRAGLDHSWPASDREVSAR